MPNSTTETSITDRALQLLGFGQIASTQQVGSRGAKSMQRAFTPVKLSELQKHFWYFSMKRAVIPASATPPLHTKSYAYPLPSDCLMLAPSDQVADFPLKKDWVVEGNQIITNDKSPLWIRYVSIDVPVSTFDAIFSEALSAALALACCEELTNSNAKQQNIAALYDEQINMAKKRGSILIQKARAPVSPWISRRG